VEARFDGPIPDLAGVPGVSAVQTDGNVVRMQVRGSIQPLLGVLAASGVTELLSREPSLEELFLAIYDTGNVA
jgi:ABC-2 type transport system ATP-binding protein